MLTDACLDLLYASRFKFTVGETSTCNSDYKSLMGLQSLHYMIQSLIRLLCILTLVLTRVQQSFIWRDIRCFNFRGPQTYMRISAVVSQSEALVPQGALSWDSSLAETEITIWLTNTSLHWVSCNTWAPHDALRVSEKHFESKQRGRNSLDIQLKWMCISG